MSGRGTLETSVGVASALKMLGRNTYQECV